MKLLLIFVDADHAAEVESCLDECGVPGYSQIPTILGRGKFGRKFGSRAFPGSSTLYFAAVEPEFLPAMLDRTSKLRDRLGSAESGLKVYSLDTAEIL